MFAFAAPMRIFDVRCIRMSHVIFIIVDFRLFSLLPRVHSLLIKDVDFYFSVLLYISSSVIRCRILVHSNAPL